MHISCLLYTSVIDENAENTAKEIEALGVKAKAYASNAANFEDTAKVVEAIHNDFGRIDILVNNAGITRDGLMMRMTEQQWDMAVSYTHLMGAMLLAGTLAAQSPVPEWQVGIDKVKSLIKTNPG